MKLNRVVLMAGLAVAMIAGAGSLQAQEEQQPRRNRGQGGPGGPGGGFDPAQMEQRMLEAVRDRLEVKEDKEWSAIEPLVKKVNSLRREQIGGGMRGFFRGGNRGGGGNNDGGNGGGNRFRGFAGEPSAEEEALSKAVESNASKDELKTKMAAFRKAKEAKEKQLKAAQDELKKVLSVKQEAVALEMGLVQ